MVSPGSLHMMMVGHGSNYDWTYEGDQPYIPSTGISGQNNIFVSTDGDPLLYDLVFLNQ